LFKTSDGSTLQLSVKAAYKSHMLGEMFDCLGLETNGERLPLNYKVEALRSVFSYMENIKVSEFGILISRNSPVFFNPKDKPNAPDYDSMDEIPLDDNEDWEKEFIEENAAKFMEILEVNLNIYNTNQHPHIGNDFFL